MRVVDSGRSSDFSTEFQVNASLLGDLSATGPGGSCGRRRPIATESFKSHEDEPVAVVCVTSVVIPDSVARQNAQTTRPRLGKRKPWLNSVSDTGRIARYASDFWRMVERYGASPELLPS